MNTSSLRVILVFDGSVSPDDSAIESLLPAGGDKTLDSEDEGNLQAVMKCVQFCYLEYMHYTLRACYVDFADVDEALKLIGAAKHKNLGLLRAYHTNLEDKMDEAAAVLELAKAMGSLYNLYSEPVAAIAHVQFTKSQLVSNQLKEEICDAFEMIGSHVEHYDGVLSASMATMLEAHELH